MFDRQDAGIGEYLRPLELIGLDWIRSPRCRLSLPVLKQLVFWQSRRI